MSDILKTYIHTFFHPKETQMLLRSDNVYAIDSERRRTLTFEESLSCSWMFSFIQAFYTILIIFLGIEYFSVTEKMPSVISRNATVLKIFFIILEFVLFPIGFWIYVKFWSKVITIFTKIFEINLENEKRTQDLLVQTMSTHTFLVLPVFGKLFSKVGSIIYLYLGLRDNLGFNAAQSIFVLLFPLFILFFTFSLMMISIVMMFAGF